MAKKDSGKNCSFCGRSGEEVDDMIASPTGSTICNECVVTCGMMLGISDDKGPSFDDEGSDFDLVVPNPKEIKVS